MSNIPTWHERAMRHPDHQSGVVSEDMIRARMCEEIADLRAHAARQAHHIKELKEKIDAEKSCACSYDAPGDICAAHSPTLAEAQAEVERLREALSWYADRRNHFLVERRNPGDPDPAVIILDEPQIMSDGGERARKALEGKP